MKKLVLLLLSIGILGCGTGLDSDNVINNTDPDDSSKTVGELTGLLQEDEETEVVDSTIPDFTGSPVKVENCDDTSLAGHDTPETRKINMGQTSGTFTFEYTTYTLKDRMLVYSGSTELFDTGCICTSCTPDTPDSTRITYSGSSQITVYVDPNCEGGSGTAWNFTVYCPD